MTDKRKNYINQLLQELKALENSVLIIRDEDTVPFSFFRESFDKMQIIMRLLHEMEILQVDDMKHQMERLVLFLSESEARRKEEDKKAEEARKAEEVRRSEEAKKAAEARIALEMARIEKINSGATDLEIEQTHPPQRQVYADKIVLPEYKNPRKIENSPPSYPATVPKNEQIAQPLSKTPHVQQPPVPKASPSRDLLKGISLNDRFLFQRELFGNSRAEMDSVTARLNMFNNYSEAEQFLKETTAWDFESQTVTTFLETIKKGF